ncbi:GntR family transcriptional regulator [Aquibacillus sediminis]|uniref:GntR family transcriptional regulator n=1 Tax=Aquibacillus sediminis TaxID=2574734 RepID=UPI00110987C8|nr:GntR family transcriptional regulator [Aquibacillus sediminis]
MLDKNSPLPIYYQLEQSIRTMIENGQLKPGELLPSEREYAEKYDISRMTVRQAINNLASEGLLVRQKGKGTFIAEQKIEQALQGITSFSEDMKARGLEPSTEIIHYQEEPAEIHIAEKLGINPDDPILEIYRIRLADHVPLAVETTFTPKAIVGNMTEQDFSESFYHYVEDTLGLTITHGDQEIESTLASPAEIEHLHLKKGDPVLLLHRLTYVSGKQPFEYVRTAYRADRYKYKIQLPR